MQSFGYNHPFNAGHPVNDHRIRIGAGLRTGDWHRLDTDNFNKPEYLAPSEQERMLTKVLADCVGSGSMEINYINPI